MGVEFSKEGRLGFITLNRPPANSYDLPMIQQLKQVIEQVASDEDVRVVIIRSALNGFFSAGADVKAFSENPPERNMEMVRIAHQVLSRIAMIPKIFIAQIGGHALGGGLEIALACDLRFGCEGNYRLGLPEVTLGLLPGNGGTQRLSRLIGWSRALDLMVTGRTLTPSEALEMGILNRVFTAEEFVPETIAYAKSVANGATRAIGAIKCAVHEGYQRPLEDALRIERELLEPLFRSEDGREGVRAFLEKRKPVFTGR